MNAPRQRVKYSIDPNVLSWANNDSKFGKRLMEKMGWEQGKGLGAKEDGIVENIKVKFKSDTKGVGFAHNAYENVWLDHQDDFDDLLSQLAKNNTNTNSEPIATTVTSGLESKSKESKARVHYKKFTRSKDLTNAMANDLDCILGRVKRKQQKDEKLEPVVKTDDEEEDEDGLAPRASFKMSHDEDTIKKEKKHKRTESAVSNPLKTNPLSYHDYFAKKMKSKLLGTSLEEEDVKEEIKVEKFDYEETEIQPKKHKSKKVKEEFKSEDEKPEEQEETGADDHKSKKNKKSKKSKIKEEEEEIVEKEEEKSTKRPKKEKKVEEPFMEAVSNYQIVKEVKIETAEFDVGSTKKAISESFPGSNLFQLHGYTPYNITNNLEAVLKDKCRKTEKKLAYTTKKLKLEPDSYNMAKKPMVVISESSVAVL